MLPSFATDEDVYAAVAAALRAAGFDAVSMPDVGRLGETDESQLEWAAIASRVLVTFNVSDFARLHAEWADQGRTPSGIVVSQQRPIGDLIQRLVRLGSSIDADSFRGRLEFLSNW